MIHILCMVKDGDKYLPDFIAHHLRLVDKIWFIDHSSSNSLKRFKSKKIKVFQYSYKAQFQGEVVTLIARHIKIKYKKGWLFILDIDEFLPFFSKVIFKKFLKSKSKKRVVGFNWVNAFCLKKNNNKDCKYISDNSNLIFTSNLNDNQKVACNLNRLTNKFAVMTGGHGISDYLFFFRKRISPYYSGRHLFHIIATSEDDFYKKINRYVDQMKYRKKVIGIGGWSVKDYLNKDNFLYTDIIAFFRSKFLIKQSKFNYKYKLISLNIFKPIIGTKLLDNFKKISDKKIPRNNLLDRSKNKLENKYIKFKRNDNAIDENIKWFYIKKNEILIREPNV